MMETALTLPPGACINLLQLTDPHLFADATGELLGVRTAESLQAVLHEAKQAQPFDFVLATGDLSQDHTSDSYLRAAQLLQSLQKPVYWLPGNHDEVTLLQEEFYRLGIPPYKWLVGEHWQIILLDTQVRDHVYGHLSDHQLAALDCALRTYPQKHTLVALHHHVQPIGCAWLDHHILKNSDELFALLARHNNVRAILNGHVHQEADSEYRSVRLLSTPSTCIQFKPLCSEFTLDETGPGWRYLQLYPDGRIATQVWRLAAGIFKPNQKAWGY